MNVKAGTSTVTVRVPALEFVTRSGPGSPVRVNYALLSGKTALAVDQQLLTTLGRDGYLTLKIPITTQKGKTYKVQLTAFDKFNNEVGRTVTVVAA